MMSLAHGYICLMLMIHCSIHCPNTKSQVLVDSYHFSQQWKLLNSSSVPEVHGALQDSYIVTLKMVGTIFLILFALTNHNAPSFHQLILINMTIFWLICMSFTKCLIRQFVSLAARSNTHCTCNCNTSVCFLLYDIDTN